MRALIIGYGSIGQRHLRNLRALVPGLQAVILRRNAAQNVQDAVVVDSLDAALSAEPTLAVLASPSAAHADPLVALIAAGIPCYVEKPVVTRRADLARITEALGPQQGGRHVTGYNLRLLASLMLAQKLIADGYVGTVARSSFTAGQWLPDWRRSDDHRQSYSSRKDEGGGVIFDLSHELDAARFLLGEVQVVSCLTMNLPSLEIEAECAASIVGRSSSGALLTVNVDYVARRPIRRYEVVGDKATLVWDLGGRRLELHKPEGVELVTDSAADFDVSHTYVAAMQSFVDYVRAGTLGPLQTLDDGLRSTELAIRAGELGQS